MAKGGMVFIKNVVCPSFFLVAYFPAEEEVD
jgi:hypothetical protein